MRYLLAITLAAAALWSAQPIAVWSQSGAPPADSVISPDEAVRLALAHNPRLRAAAADAATARALYQEARSLRLPSVRTQASYLRLTGNIPEVDFTFPGLDTTFTLLPIELSRYQAELNVEQPLFTGFRVRNEIRAAAARADAAAYQSAQQEADLALEVRAAYWELYRARALREALDASLAMVDEHVRVVEARLAEQSALRRDLLAARTRRSEVTLERLDAANAAELARLELNRLAGLPLDAPTRPVEDAAVAPIALSPDTLRSLALAARPQLRALAEEVSALRLQLSATRGAWLPQVSAVGRYLYARPNPYFYTEQDVFRGTGEFGLALQWNLFEGGARSARTRQAAARLASAEARLAEAREAIQVDVTRRHLALQRAEQAIAVAALHVEEAEETFRVVRQQFLEEAALSSDVLEAERNFRTARARQAQADADYALARAALLNALGRTW